MLKWKEWLASIRKRHMPAMAYLAKCEIIFGQARWCFPEKGVVEISGPYGHHAKRFDVMTGEELDPA